MGDRCQKVVEGCLSPALVTATLVKLPGQTRPRIPGGRGEGLLGAWVWGKAKINDEKRLRTIISRQCVPMSYRVSRNSRPLFVLTNLISVSSWSRGSGVAEDKREGGGRRFGGFLFTVV